MAEREHGRRYSTGGYTLVEMLVVVAIFGSILLVTIPNIRGRYETYLVRNNARGCASILKLGRMKAVANNSNFVVELNPAMATRCPGRTGGTPTNAMVAYEEGALSPSDCFSSNNGIGIESVAAVATSTVLFRSNGMAKDLAPNYFLIKSRNGRQCQLLCVNAAGIVRVNDSGEGATYCEPPYGATNSTNCPADVGW